MDYDSLSNIELFPMYFRPFITRTNTDQEFCVFVENFIKKLKNPPDHSYLANSITNKTFSPSDEPIVQKILYNFHMGWSRISRFLLQNFLPINLLDIIFASSPDIFSEYELLFRNYGDDYSRRRSAAIVDYIVNLNNYFDFDKKNTVLRGGYYHKYLKYFNKNLLSNRH